MVFSRLKVKLKLLQVIEKKVTVIEGMGPGQIDVQSSVPPQYLCNGLDVVLCRVFIIITFVSTKEFMCPNTDIEIPQLVFPYMDTSEDGKL